MDLGEVISWVIVGGLAGALADVVVKGVRLDLVGAIVIGILAPYWVGGCSVRSASGRAAGSWAAW